jgi:hypothetical protein
MNSTQDIVFRRCGCTDDRTGRQFTGPCSRPAEQGHGSWYYAVRVTTAGGRKARYRRGGFATREEADAARQAILDGPADSAAARAWTVARWLRYWLNMAESHLRPSTAHGYRDHIEVSRTKSESIFLAVEAARDWARAERALCTRNSSGQSRVTPPLTRPRVTWMSR